MLLDHNSARTHIWRAAGWLKSLKLVVLQKILACSCGTYGTTLFLWNMGKPLYSHMTGYYFGNVKCSPGKLIEFDLCTWPHSKSTVYLLLPPCPLANWHQQMYHLKTNQNNSHHHNKRKTPGVLKWFNQYDLC